MRPIRLFSTAILILLMLGPVNARAEVDLYRSGNTGGESSGFHYILKPGEKITDKISLVNQDEADAQLDLSAKDALVTQDGSFTIQAEESASTGVGNWVRLPFNKLVLSPKQSTEFQFQIAVPDNAAAGEYAGGIAATFQTGASGTVKVLKRKGIRVYITVPGDLKLDGKVSALSILDPSRGDFKIAQDKYGFAGKDNLVATFQAENTGNLYATLKAKFTLTTPGQDPLVREQAWELAPGTGPREYYFISNAPYATGANQLTMEWELQPQDYLLANPGQSDQSGYRLIPSPDKTLPRVAGRLQTQVDFRSFELDSAPTAKQKAVAKSGEEFRIEIPQKKTSATSPDYLAIAAQTLNWILALIIAGLHLFNTTKSTAKPRKPKKKTRKIYAE